MSKIELAFTLMHGTKPVDRVRTIVGQHSIYAYRTFSRTAAHSNNTNATIDILGGRLKIIDNVISFYVVPAKLVAGKFSNKSIRFGGYNGKDTLNHLTIIVKRLTEEQRAGYDMYKSSRERLQTMRRKMLAEIEHAFDREYEALEANLGHYFDIWD